MSKAEFDRSTGNNTFMSSKVKRPISMNSRRMARTRPTTNQTLRPQNAIAIYGSKIESYDNLDKHKVYDNIPERPARVMSAVNQ